MFTSGQLLIYAIFTLVTLRILRTLPYLHLFHLQCDATVGFFFSRYCYIASLLALLVLFKTFIMQNIQSWVLSVIIFFNYNSETMEFLKKLKCYIFIKFPNGTNHILFLYGKVSCVYKKLIFHSFQSGLYLFKINMYFTAAV